MYILYSNLRSIWLMKFYLFMTAAVYSYEVYWQYIKNFSFSIYLLLAMLDLCCCLWAFPGCSKWDYMLILLIVMAFLVVQQELQGTKLQASVVAACRLSNCDSQAQLPHSMWNPPGPEVKAMPHALAGIFLTTRPPRKSKKLFS